MSINLEDYEEFLAAAAPEIKDVLEGTFHEAARVMSPAGLEEYMDGAKALAHLGRGSGVVISFVQEMPLVVKECGEDIIGDCITAAMKLSSMTSGEVVALLFDSMPSAARNLGDAELFRGYLTLIHQLASTASRGVRPMLNHIDELLSKLTLSGLRRSIHKLIDQCLGFIDGCGECFSSSVNNTVDRALDVGDDGLAGLVQ